MSREKYIKLAVIALVVLALCYVLFRGGKYAIERSNSPFEYFTYEEFDSPDEPGSGRRMKDAVIRTYDRIRKKVGFPMIVNSGVRTVGHNHSVGGVSDSAHIGGWGADFYAPTDAMKRKIAAAAISEGITRIGWGGSFIHLDMDPSKTPRLTWGYGSATAPSYASLAQLAQSQYA